MKDIVIYCPNKVHEQPRHHQKTDSFRVVPKILIIISDDTSGKIKVQCNDSMCKNSKEGHKGWYEICLNGLGGYTITSIPKQYFKLNQVPTAIMEES